jgi:hypothetical protein
VNSEITAVLVTVSQESDQETLHATEEEDFFLQATSREELNAGA